MTDQTPSEADPVDVEPTDNSTGQLVDLDAVEEVEAEARQETEAGTKHDDA
jgi:hypothetical protein